MFHKIQNTLRLKHFCPKVYEVSGSCHRRAIIQESFINKSQVNFGTTCRLSSINKTVFLCFFKFYSRVNICTQTHERDGVTFYGDPFNKLGRLVVIRVTFCSYSCWSKVLTTPLVYSYHTFFMDYLLYQTLYRSQLYVISIFVCDILVI